MRNKFDFDAVEKDRTVYVREVSVQTLPEDVQEQLSDMDTVYAVHAADGERLALVPERKLAFMLARDHDLAPVTVH